MKDAILLVLGAIISAWTGIVTSRYFAFAQERQRALEIVLSLGAVFKEILREENPFVATDHVSGLLLGPLTALNAQGHWRASRELATLSLTIKKTLTDARREINQAQELAQSEIMDHPALEICVKKAMDTLPTMISAGVRTVQNVDVHWLSLAIGQKPAYKVARTIAWIRNRYSIFTEHTETGEAIDEIWRRRVNEEREQRNDKNV